MNKKLVHVIASTRPEYYDLSSQLNKLGRWKFKLIKRPEDLNESNLKKINPDFIFFPHWSYIIPKSIFLNYNCIIFHMTDVPFGRGGSPLQNLIARGIYKTKMSAIQCIGELDAGPVYLKKTLSLKGPAAEIFERCSKLIFIMIREILNKKLVAKKQSGDVTQFKRRTRSDGDLQNLDDLTKIYDYIRMLDAEGYPPAFLETEHFVFEFSDARILKNKVRANVRIRKKDR